MALLFIPRSCPLLFLHYRPGFGPILSVSSSFAIPSLPCRPAHLSHLSSDINLQDFSSYFCRCSLNFSFLVVFFYFSTFASWRLLVSGWPLLLLGVMLLPVRSHGSLTSECGDTGITAAKIWIQSRPCHRTGFMNRADWYPIIGRRATCRRNYCASTGDRAVFRWPHSKVHLCCKLLYYSLWVARCFPRFTRKC